MVVPCAPQMSNRKPGLSLHTSQKHNYNRNGPAFKETMIVGLEFNIMSTASQP